MTAPLRRRALGLDRTDLFHDYAFTDYSMDHDAFTLMIDQWHDSDSGKELHEFLGWTEEEHRHYGETSYLPW